MPTPVFSLNNKSPFLVSTHVVIGLGVWSLYFVGDVSHVEDAPRSMIAMLQNSRMESVRRPCVGDVRDYVTCRLCHGYLVDAVTVVRCLHTCEYLTNGVTAHGGVVAATLFLGHHITSSLFTKFTF